MPESKHYLETFGPNAWLIEEMHRQFREQPNTVAEGWRDFFGSRFLTIDIVKKEAVAKWVSFAYIFLCLKP